MTCALIQVHVQVYDHVSWKVCCDSNPFCIYKIFKVWIFAHRVSTNCSLKKIYKCLSILNYTRTHVLLLNNLHKKNITESRYKWNFNSNLLSFTTLHLLQICSHLAWRINLPLANQKHVIFSCILLDKEQWILNLQK